MSIFKKTFRYSFTSVLFVIGLTISCFVLLNVAELVDKMTQQDKQLHNYVFEESVLMFPGGVEYTEEEALNYKESIIQYLENEEKGNLYTSCLVQLNKKLEQYTAKILIKQNENLNLSYTPVNDYDIENGILIGESLEKDICCDEQGKYIELDGIRMPIIGILDNVMAGGIDYSIYILWQNANLSLKQYLISLLQMDMTIDFKSQENINANYQKFWSDMEAKGYHLERYEDIYEGDYQNAWYEMYNSVFMPICLVFSICNCFIVSYIWLLQRKKELGIRKAYGYNNFQIVTELGKDIIQLSLVSIVLALCMQVAIKMIFKEPFFEGVFVSRFILVVLGMLGIIGLNLILLFINTRKLAPISILKE